MNPKSHNGRYVKIGVIVAVLLIAFAGLLTLAPTWPWVRATAFLLGILILAGMAYFPMAHQATLNAKATQTPLPTTTAAMPVADSPKDQAAIIIPPMPITAPRVSRRTNGRPSSRLHELVHRQKVTRQIKVIDETTFLVIVLYTRVRIGPFRYKWDVKRWQLELVDSPYVNKRLAKRIPFFPVDSEHKILWLRRNHWWSHGPVQLLILTVGFGVLMFLAVIYPSLPGAVMMWLATCWCILCALVYYALWIKWGYHYLVMTDVKLRYPYTPPFFAHLNMPEVNLDQLKGGVNYDKTQLGRILGFGSLKSDTPGNNQKVEGWLGNLRFIPHCEAFARILSQARDDLSRS